MDTVTRSSPQDAAAARRNTIISTNIIFFDMVSKPSLRPGYDASRPLQRKNYYCSAFASCITGRYSTASRYMKMPPEIRPIVTVISCQVGK